MKRIKIILLSIAVFTLAAESLFAQQSSESGEWLKNKDDAFNFYINLHNSGNVFYKDGEYQETNFKTDQFRLEMRGEVAPGVSYRVRHRMNRANYAASLDNLSRATDIASISLAVTDNFTITAGKQCAAFGGFEFDLNPIDIYQYSDMIEYMDNFLTGVDFAYQWQDQQFRFQVVNSRTDYIDEVFSALPAEVEQSKNPLGYTLNWNGSFFEGFVKTRWSYAIYEEAEDHQMNYTALGTQFNFTSDFYLNLDYLYSHEDIDRKGIVSDMVQMQTSDEAPVFNANYSTAIAKAGYAVNQKWELFVKGMYETASHEDEVIAGDEKLRTSLGYFAGFEYKPVPNCKIFATYMGRAYDFEQYVTQSIGADDYTTSQISLGIIYRLQMF